MKTLAELINDADGAMPLIRGWAEQSTQTVDILPPSERRGEVLLGLQVSTRSCMGAVAHDTGGLLLDHGWLRFLGSGHASLPRNLLDWNDGKSNGFLLVADDVVGGFFAINGGGLGDDAGCIYYRAPDTLEWESLDIGYSDFLEWSLSERLQQFYAELRWPDWQADVARLDGDQCFSFFPFLWTREGSVTSSARTVVGIGEQFAISAGGA